MNYREIGSTGVKVSEISVGCWTMGGLNWVNGFPNGWSNVDEDEITRAIKTALDAGVNHFDNADVYGNGRAEQMLGRIFHKLGVKTEEVLIATKVGHFPGTAASAYEPAHIRHQCEQSLINLRRDYVDIYYFHHGNFGPNNEELHPAAEMMETLVKEGKARIKGQSAYSFEDFEKTVPVVRPAVLQSWAHALDDQFVRPGSPLVGLMEKYDLSFVAFSPLAQARLLGKFDPSNPPAFEEGDHRRSNKAFGSEALAALQPKIEALRQRFGNSTEALAAAALDYVLAQPRVACVIPGFRNERQMTCNLSGGKLPMSPADVAWMRELFKSENT
jgi:aryl-alcohol dehydrogenase-like predicted oxidoreductase